MKNSHVLIFVAVAAVVVYFGYQNQKNTGSVLGGTGIVGGSNTASDYSDLIDNLTSGLSANFGGQSATS